MSHSGTVTKSIENGVARITFGHPQHNSLPLHLLHELVTAITACDSEDVKIILLQSTGNRTFCAGANFDDMLACRTVDEAKAFFGGFGSVLNAMRSSSCLVVARLQGKAVGGGVGLAAAADYAMGTKWSSIRLSELFIGIGPYVIGPALQRKIGLAAFSQLAINSEEWQTAAWAQSHGLLQEVFDTADQLDNYLERFLIRCRSYTAASIKNLKEVLWQGTSDWENLLQTRAAISGDLLMKPETQAKVRAMAEQIRSKKD